MKGVLWVQLNGMDKPAAIGRGDAVQQGSLLVLFDEDRNVIGTSSLLDRREIVVGGWMVCRRSSADG